MNGFYKITQSLYDVLIDKGFRVVTLGDDFKVDLERQTIFPYAHIVPMSTLKQGNVTQYTFSISGMDLVDFNKDENDSFFTNDNIQDVLNDVHNRLSQVLEFYERGASGNYKVEGESTLTAFMHRFKNVLTGWEVDITLTIPTDGTIC